MVVVVVLGVVVVSGTYDRFQMVSYLELHVSTRVGKITLSFNSRWNSACSVHDRCTVVDGSLYTLLPGNISQFPFLCFGQHKSLQNFHNS